MSDIMVSMHDEDNIKEDETLRDAYQALAGNLENLLKAAEPRLAQLAQRFGVPPDVVGDVVQETLVAAWQNLAHLRSPSNFESWLDGICRNMSRRWARAQSTTDLHQRTFSSLQPEQEDVSMISRFDIADPQFFDLSEELNRHDLVSLKQQFSGAKYRCYCI